MFDKIYFRFVYFEKNYILIFYTIGNEYMLKS